VEMEIKATDPGVSIVEETAMDTTDAYGNPIQSRATRGIGMKTT
jgi:hypothetical protein